MEIPPSHIAPRAKKPRPRTAYSCEPCRERKVKCDRGHPCKRCVNAGLEKPCVYRSKDSPRSKDGNVESQISPPQVQDEAIPTFGNSAFRMNSSVEGLQHNFSLCRGKNFTTRYYSRSHEVGFMSELAQLKDFVRRASSAHYDVSAQRKRFEIAKEFHQARRRQETLDDVQKLSNSDFLQNLLPDVNKQTQLLLLYATKFETIYRIIHLPALLNHLEGSAAKTTNLNPIINAQLLVICSIASSLDTIEAAEYTGESTPARDGAVRVIRILDTWLKTCYPKRPTVDVLQIRCLLIMLRRIYGIDEEQIWSFTCEVVILAKSMGLHRDPDIWKKMTPYAAEIRRRLWATIIEFHIQASIERGMTPCIREEECDCHPPANLDDDQLQMNMALVPEAKPSQVFTQSSLQLLLTRSQSLRLKLVHRINGLRWDMTQREVMNLEHQIMDYKSALQGESQILSTVDKVTGLEDPVVFPFTSLFQLQLRQFDLLLLQPFTIAPDCQSGAFERRTCLEISTATIETSTEYLNSTDMGIKYLIPYSMVVRSALYICQEIIRPTSQTSGFILNQRLATISAAIDIIKTRLVMIGRGLRDYALLSMSLGFVLSSISTTKSSTEENSSFVDASERVAAACRMMLDKMEHKEAPNDDNMHGNLPTNHTTEHNGGRMVQTLPGDLATLDMSLFVDWMPDAVWDFDTEGNFGTSQITENIFDGA